MEVNQHRKAALDRRMRLEKELVGKLRFIGIELKNNLIQSFYREGDIAIRIGNIPSSGSDQFKCIPMCESNFIQISKRGVIRVQMVTGHCRHQPQTHRTCCPAAGMTPREEDSSQRGAWS